MGKEISLENHKFISHWIMVNPNLKDLIFINNVIKYEHEEIDLKNFLISELLNNEYFANNIYSMNKNEFLNIIKFHTKSEEILKNKSEYIKHIKINEKGKAIVVTNGQTITIEKISANEVISKYNSLLLTNNYYVPIETLLKELNLEELSYGNFFSILRKKEELNEPESKYIQAISKFIFALNDNEHLLIGNAKFLLNKYMIEMNSLKYIDSLTPAQKYALTLYEDYIKILENESKKNEETKSYSSSSYGYSTLWMIIASVISTILVITFLMLCN